LQIYLHNKKVALPLSQHLPITIRDMTTAQNIEAIIANTNASVIVKGKDSIKAIYGKRHVVVSYDKSQDLFNLYAFNLRGINISKEETVKGLFINQVKETILNLI
jgi:hypothetical protein